MPPEVLEARISTLLKRKTVLTVNDLASRPKQSPSTEVPEKEASSTSTEADVPQFTRSELCRFCSTVEDLRKIHRNVL